MYCQFCQNELISDAVFCNRCGARVKDKASSPFDTNTAGATDHFNNNLQPPPPTRPLHLSQYSAYSAELPQPQQIFSPAIPFQSVGTPRSNSLLSIPTTTTQRLLIRMFQPTLASNALLGSTLGALLAAIMGIVIAGGLLTLAHMLAPHTAQSAMNGEGASLVDSALNITSLGSPWRDSLQLFLSMHGPAVIFHYNEETSSLLLSFNAALDGLIIIPAFLLIFGGYIAASTDLQNRARNSLLRGASIAIPYSLLLLIIVPQVNGCIQNGALTQNHTNMCTTTMTIDAGSVLLLGLLWGGLFGMLGASLKLVRGDWHQMIFQYLRSSPYPQLSGMIAGGIGAVGLGISLSLLFFFSTFTYTAFSSPIFTKALCMTGDWQVLTFWSATQGFLHAINLFFFSLGAPIQISNPMSAPCFYTSSKAATLSLFNGTLQGAPWFYIVSILSLFSLFLGGRVSVTASRVQGYGPGAIQGALIAFPFTLLLLLLNTICARTTTIATNAPAMLRPSYIQFAGVSTLDLILWALMSSALFGALGGIYQMSPLKKYIGKFLFILAVPLTLFCTPGYFILDRLSGVPRHSRRGSAKTLLYSAFLCVLLLMIASAIAGATFIILNQTLLFEDNQRIRNILSVLLIALPGILLLGACASALSTGLDPTTNFDSNFPASSPEFRRGVI